MHFTRIWLCKLLFFLCASEEEAEEMNSSVWGKLNKGVSNVTVYSEALLFKRTASKGNTWPLPSLVQLYRVAQTNIVMWESRDNFTVFLLGAFLLSCLTVGSACLGKQVSSVWPGKFSLGLEILTPGQFSRLSYTACCKTKFNIKSFSLTT